MTGNHEIVKVLLVVYASVLIVNAALATFCFYQYKHKLYKYSLYLWIGSFVNFFLQGQFQVDPLAMTLCFSTYFFCSLIFVQILGSVQNIVVPLRKYAFFMAGCLVISGIFYSMQARFVWLALPTAIGVSFPMFHIAIKTLSSKRDFSHGMRAFCYLLLLNAVHFMDYPFLRNDPTYAVFGFSLALILLIAFSGFLPSFITKEISDQYSDRLEKAVQQRTEKLQETNIKLESLTAENKHLIFIISHDIATSLQVIINHVELQLVMPHTRLNQKLESSLNKIFKSVQCIKEILENVKNLQAIREGKNKLEITAVDLSDIVSKAQFLHEDRLNAKKIKCQLDNRLASNVRILGEQKALKNHVINNLLTNAIKFSYPNSEINILMEEKDGFVHLVVSDFGIGMPKKILENVFNPQIPTTQKGTTGEVGTGFGLPIVKTCLDQYGAKIWVESRTEKDDPIHHGTSFHIYFKKAVAATDQQAA